MALLCLADWVLIEDLGFLGGVGTDPNSMIPMILVVVAGFLALSPASTTADARSTDPATVPSPPVDTGGAKGPPRLGLAKGGAAAGSVRQALVHWRRRLAADSTYAFRSLAALGAIGITLIGVAPMAAAATNPNADPILAQAVNGPPEVTNIPTPAFNLVDQYGRGVSLGSLHGKTVALVFLDPTCTYQAGGCPAIQELRLVDQVLGSRSNRVELVAIDTNPNYLKPNKLVTFDRRAGLDKMSNWLCLTGSLSELTNVLNGFGVHASDTGSNMRLMMGLPHGQTAYVIDGSGRTREVLSTGDRGPASKLMTSSVAVDLANAVGQVVSSNG
jgi:cytochrome oxidase Cu insertion factor (SCO1/SenC/PrrC family)